LLHQRDGCNDIFHPPVAVSTVLQQAPKAAAAPAAVFKKANIVKNVTAGMSCLQAGAVNNTSSLAVGLTVKCVSCAQTVP
jgi:hypothetical protein